MEKMTLLIVDDEARIRSLIAKYASFEGYGTDEAENGMQAVQKCREKKYDLIIMDVMMPELDGFSAGEEYDRIHGFEIGVDDYVVKPFSPRELMMRVSAVLKRSGGPQEGENDVVTLGELKVNFTARRVTVAGQEISLSPKEYDLLFYMVRNRGIALSREKLLTEVWGYDFFGDDRTLDTHIKLLRRELGPCADRITTLRGVGYRCWISPCWWGSSSPWSGYARLRCCTIFIRRTGRGRSGGRRTSSARISTMTIWRIWRTGSARITTYA